MLRTYLQALRRFSRDVRLYLLTSALLGFTVFGGISTVLNNLYLVRLGYGPEFIGLVNAAGELSFAVFGLPAGMLGAQLNSRHMLIAGMAVGVGVSLLLPAAEYVPVALRSPWILLVFVLSSLGFALYFVGSNPFLMLRTTPQERIHVYAIQSALWPLAGFAGSVVGGLLPGFLAQILDVSLAGPVPYRYPLLISAALLGPSVVALLLTRPMAADRTPAAAPVTAHHAAPSTLVLMLGLVTGLVVVGEGAGRFFFNVYLDDGLHVPTAQIGFLSGLAQLVAVPAALITPVLALRWGNRAIVIAAGLGSAAGLLPMALIGNPAGVGFGFMAVMVMASIRRPAMLVYAMELVPAAWHAKMSGAITMAVGLSWFGIALLGGYIIAAFGYRSLFLLSASLTAVGAVALWLYFRPSGRHHIVVEVEEHGAALDAPDVVP